MLTQKADTFCSFYKSATGFSSRSMQLYCFMSVFMTSRLLAYFEAFISLEWGVRTIAGVSLVAVNIPNQWWIESNSYHFSQVTCWKDQDFFKIPELLEKKTGYILWASVGRDNDYCQLLGVYCWVEACNCQASVNRKPASRSAQKQKQKLRKCSEKLQEFTTF